MKIFRTLVAIVVCAFISSQAIAQSVKTPAPSSTQTFTQDFGLGKITVTYSRPNVRGRVIFGDLVPYGKVWRTGANSATLLKLTEDVTIEGKVVPAGEYGLFTIPGKDGWTIIVSKGSKQWGAYAYNQADDLVRFTVKPVNLKDKVETFTIDSANVYETSSTLQLKWANTLVPLNLKVDIDSRVMASIDEAMKGEKKPYMQAALYYFNNNKDINKALEWMNAAEAENQKAPWVRYWKARMQLKTGDKKGAAATAEAGIKLAEEAKNEEYVRLNSTVLAEAKK